MAPKGDATRPTSDRVLEALFSILGAHVVGADVLDLYAGTGALSFEALSRGARSAVLVERAREALAAIRANVLALDLAANVRVVEGVAAAFIHAFDASASFDLVFVDPPYRDTRSGVVTGILERLLAKELLRMGGLLVLEHDGKDAPPDLPGLVRGDTRGYGDTALTFYTRGD